MGDVLGGFCGLNMLVSTSFFHLWPEMIHLSHEKVTYGSKRGHDLKNLVRGGTVVVKIPWNILPSDTWLNGTGAGGSTHAHTQALPVFLVYQDAQAFTVPLHGSLTGLGLGDMNHE